MISLYKIPGGSTYHSYALVVESELSHVSWDFPKKFFFKFIYSPVRERDRGRGEGGREIQNPKQALGCEVSAQSPTRGWNSQTVLI